jgi:two-component system, NarL family, nitrate/nitrite response regulator NarL
LFLSFAKAPPGGRWIEEVHREFVLRAGAHPVHFTERERAVLRCIVEGLSNKDTSTRLGISDSAVKGTVRRLFAETGVRTRGQLIRVGLRKFEKYV